MSKFDRHHRRKNTSKETRTAEVSNQDYLVYNQEVLLTSRCGHMIRENATESVYSREEELCLLMYGEVDENEYPLKRVGSH